MKTIFKRLKVTIEYNWAFLKVLVSPFKPLKLVWDFGEIKHGTPYFLPRKWVKFTKKDAIEKANEYLANPKLVVKPFDELVKSYMGYRKAVQTKYFGFNFTTLGWKTKWDNYRFEWNPCISFVIFGKQLFIGIIPNIDKDCMHDVYWEAWLNYEYKTDETKSETERLKELISKHSCTWIRYKDGEKITTDYYPHILKEKYHYLIVPIEEKDEETFV